MRTRTHQGVLYVRIASAVARSVANFNNRGVGARRLCVFVILLIESIKGKQHSRAKREKSNVINFTRFNARIAPD